MRDRLSTVPQQLPEQHHVAEHVHQRVIVEGMTFSPPEELPSHDHEDARAGHGSSGGQPAWFMRFGEYLQKRATQAGSMMSPLLDPAPRTPTASYPTVTTPTRRTPNPPQPRLFTAAAEQRMKQWVRQAPLLYGQANNGSGSSPESLTQEQVVAEVQKRVQQEMQQHFERQSALEAENVQLKGILEAMLANQAPGPGVQGADVTERVSRPQGGATSSAEARQDGILEAPVRSQERPPGNPPGLSQGDGAQWGCGPEVLRASGAPPLHDSAR